MKKTKTSKKRNRESYLSNKGKWPSAKSSSKNSNPVSRGPPLLLQLVILISALIIPQNAFASSLSIQSPANTTYNSLSVAFTWYSGEPLSNSTYSLNGAANITISANTTITAKEGSNTLALYGAGQDNCSNSTAVHFTVDTKTPAIELDFSQNATFLENPIHINYTISELGVNCSYSLNDCNPIPCNSTITSDAQEGSNNLLIKCTDIAGNTGSASTTFTLNTKEHISISAISPNTTLRINSQQYIENQTFSTPRGNIVTIETTFNNRTYTDEIKLDRSIGLYINATQLNLPNSQASYFDISSSYKPYMIYIIDNNHTSNSTILLTSGAPLDDVILTGLHITNGGAVYISDHHKESIELYIENLIILGTLEITSGTSPQFDSSNFELNSSTIFGRTAASPALTNIYANLMKANDILFKGRPAKGYHIQELKLKGLKDTDGLKINNTIDEAYITILKAGIENAAININCESRCYLNKKGPLNDEIVKDNTMFWYRAKDPLSYNFTLDWRINSKKNPALTLHDNSIGTTPHTLFNINTGTGIHISSGKKPSSLFLPGPYISISELLIDDTGTNIHDTQINFHSIQNPQGFKGILSSYKNNAATPSCFSEQVVMKVNEGRLSLSNNGSGIQFNMMDGQNIILLSGTDEFTFKSNTSEWKKNTVNAHFITENITFNLDPKLASQQDKWFTSPLIDISHFNFTIIGPALKINMATTYNRDTAYILVKNIKDKTSPFEKHAMQSASGTWTKSFSLAQDETYHIIAVATQNDGMQGKAIERIIPIENIPPAITILEPAGDATTNNPDFSVSLIATDNMAEELMCFLEIDGIMAAEKKVHNSTQSTITAINIPQGTHTYRITCKDQSSNSAATSVSQLIIDTTPPETVIINSPNQSEKLKGTIPLNISASDSLAKIGTITAHITDSANNQIQASLARTGNYYTGKYDSSGLADGTQAITVTATDNAGNINNSAKTNIIADNTAPQITITADKKSAIISDIIKFTLYINQSSYNESTLKLTITGDTYTETTLSLTKTDSLNTYIARHDTEGMPAGTYEIKASVEDETGNKGEDATTITISEKYTDSSTASTNQGHPSSINQATEPENNNILKPAEKSTASNPANTPDINHSTGNSTGNTTSEDINAAALDAEEKESAQKTISPTGYIAGAVYSLKSYILLIVALAGLSILISFLQTPAGIRIPGQNNYKSRSSSARTARLRKISQLTGRRQIKEYS